MTCADDITKATGETNPAMLQKIEEVMRHIIFHSTLDWQPVRQFNKGAREAVEVLKTFDAEGIEWKG